MSEINKTIAEFMGICFHPAWKYDARRSCKYKCVSCGRTDWLERKVDAPDYCSEDSPRRLLAEVEAKAIEKFGGLAYIHALYEANDKTLPFELVSPICFITASAEQRCRAIVLLERRDEN